MSADLKSMRVVPSGKVYKQMFEAQVQLNRSLTKIPREATSLKTSRGGTTIPVVHLSKADIDHGLLGDRQKSWVESFPNDPYTENPVVYKQYAEYVGSQMEEPVSSIEGKEVQGLPDVVVAAKDQSDIIERIAASRKERHESTVEEMHQELSVINSEMEPQIIEASESLIEKLQENDKVIAEIFSRFEKDEDLLSYPLEGLVNLWQEIQGHTPVRHTWIQELDNTLSTVEDQRMDMIKHVFRDYAKSLEKIAHILAPDLHRFMDKESQLINQTVLSNRRAYGDLFVRLMSMDIEREKSQHSKWKRRVDDWKTLKTELAIKGFKVFMSDDKIVSPPGVTKVTQYMLKEQEVLSQKRLELINQLSDLQPPSSTKTAVYHWNKGVQDISQEIDTANQIHLGSLHKEYETTCQICLEEIDRIKVELVESGVCSESRAKTVVEEFMVPLVGDRQRVYEQNLETMEKNLEEHNKVTTERLKSLFKFAQGAAHVWDVHEIGLARQERALQEKLEQCRQQHDNQNQDKEAHLDIMMDRMRQDATEKNLKDSLTKVLEMLDKIRHSYEIFHKDQTQIVKQYPDMVKGELTNYDDALCRLFAVGRNIPLDTVVDGQANRQGEEEEEEGATTQCKKARNVSEKASKGRKGSVRFNLEEGDLDKIADTPANTESRIERKDDSLKKSEGRNGPEDDEEPIDEDGRKLASLNYDDAEEEMMGQDKSKLESSNDDDEDSGKGTTSENQLGDVTDDDDPIVKADNDCNEVAGENAVGEIKGPLNDSSELVQKEPENQEENKESADLDGSATFNREVGEKFPTSKGEMREAERVELRSEGIDKDATGDADEASDATDRDLEEELKALDEAATVVTDKKKKGFLSKIPFKKEPAQDLQSAVNEILSTSKGTIFYVLTEAGEFGIPPEKSTPQARGSTQQDPTSTAFMTEVSGMSDEDGALPEYIRTIDLKDSLLVEIKKVIRMNFLNHLEVWTEQASERASSVVVAKCEELNSELDLRLHLHKPRSRRAEYDVHNVRAAELVMHSERVTRHCKGIQQALTEVRNRFTNMTTEHNNLAAKFRQEIESLEVVFINATKASKLYGLKNQLNLELDKFMSIIRASLRQFRQHLDETLQMLRESNARFIKSFKVFSDGGNFCPEEIEEYRKRLDKMANNIDRSEGSIMSDLEDMESKRLEQATKVAMEFEDRFKSHMFDLIFMEKIARWLTNTQVKIKAEVANSNTQAQTLARHLLDIERRIDACERPNLDKEQITAEELNASLKGVFESFQMRSEYLNCLRDPSVRPASGVMQGAPGLGARVGFVHDSGPTPISKAGKQPSEDPSVGVIKTIMKSNKSKMRFGMDADLDGDFTPTERDKMKSAMSTNTSSDRGKTNASRHGVSPGVVSGTDTVRKTQSAATRRTSKPAKFEKKTVIFGETNEENENASNFLSIIKKTLKEALDGLLSSSELYYRQKGNRLVTRPQALQETFELCADVIIQKLQLYYQQADEYHNQCLQEFRHQLTQLEKSVAHIPSLVMSGVLRAQVSHAQQASQAHNNQFTQALVSLQDKQDEHKHQLRPGLGHPHQKQNLVALCEAETARHQEYIHTVEQHAKVLQETAVSHAQKFLEAVARLSEQQLLQYDNMLVVDDVEKGRVELKKFPTTELIRRKNAGEPLEEDEDKNALPRGKNVWSGLVNNELVSGEKPSKVQLTASVTTAKTTLAHTATIKARDVAYQDYKLKFEATLQLIDDEKQKLLVAEKRWMDSWNTSVDKVKQLY